MKKKMWSGRFQEATNELVEAFTESVSYDRKLYAQDIAGSKAHARMLSRQGVLTSEEADSIVSGLDKVLAEIENGDFVWRTDYEDVHMNVESRLSELIGDAGRKLHTGRSRNDQVALGFRLYVSARLRAWQEGVAQLISALMGQSEQHTKTLLPGYTHLQPAQPVLLAQHLLAYAWMFHRDYERLSDARKRVERSPLGAAALAGTTYPLDPHSVADEVGFSGVFMNSMDAVSDRDFALEAMFDGALIMMHTSRICEEIIFWANPNFGYVALPDAYATGSSIMPQKKNPDVAELIRGKTGRVYGGLISLLTTMKGLPLAYNRDMQEDKEPFFDVDETVSGALALMAGMVEELTFLPEPMRNALDSGFLNATELADYMVGKGIPFRDAHHLTGQAVALAESTNLSLEQLSLEQLQEICPQLDNDVFEALSMDAAVARRTTHGGTGPKSVAEQLKTLREWKASLK